MANTKAYPYYVVIEEAPTGEEQHFEIVGEKKADKDGVNYIEWRQNMMTFDHYNRNRRKWNAGFMRTSLKHPWISQLFERKGGVPGESAHPYCQFDGQRLSIERIRTIDPERTCLLLKKYEFEGDRTLWGTFQTLDDGEGNPGDKLRRNILQGIIPSVSVRSLVPQTKTPTGCIDVIGPGQVVCWDRVYYPSEEDAFADTKTPFKIVNKNVGAKVSRATESIDVEIALPSYAYENSDNCKFILDGEEEMAMESAQITEDGMFATCTSEGLVFIPLEDRIKRDIRNFMK